MNIAAQIQTINLGISKLGATVYAKKDIKKGEEIITFTGRYLTFKQALNLGKGQCFTLQTNLNSYLYLDVPTRFINHSCSPNCGVNELVLVALRDIKNGEELFYDYSTTMLERSWTMVCNCGTARCRKVIEDFDLLPPSVQAYYVKLNIVQPFITNNLKHTP